MRVYSCVKNIYKQLDLCETKKLSFYKFLIFFIITSYIIVIIETENAIYLKNKNF